jgi:hypothetical protein
MHAYERKITGKRKNGTGRVTALADRLFQMRRLVSFRLLVLSEQARRQACNAAVELHILTGCTLNANAKYYLQNYVVRFGTMEEGLGNINCIICLKHDGREGSVGGSGLVRDAEYRKIPRL